jgi:hypothetical protein
MDKALDANPPQIVWRTTKGGIKVAVSVVDRSGQGDRGLTSTESREERDMSTPLIYAALNAVMEDVGAVKKNGFNDFQKFNFRGIDAVVNAVYPALIKHRVSVTPNVRTYDYGTIETGQGNNRKPMGHARVVVEYTFTAAEDGSAVTASAAGEAFDSGDKATPKAMSVALRTALLQSLMLPTDEQDPDASTYERGPAVDPVVVARVGVKVAWEETRGAFDPEIVASGFQDWSQGESLHNADAYQLDRFAAWLRAFPAADAGNTAAEAKA